MNLKPIYAIIAAAMLLPMQAAFAQDKIPSRDIYGYQLMTPQERNEYRAKMRAAKTAEEREAIRAEHHAAMSARAKERGVTLPEQPPARGGGMGPGGGGRRR